MARPRTKPCVVPLFTNVTFADFSPKPFAYAPPADCPGPWAKVVFEADYAVTAGRQFDRTANVWIGGANVYFGTTAEPSRTVARSWHIEHDLTDHSALLSRAQPGEADLGNIVDSTYTGILTGSARLAFYPLEPRAEAPNVPDVVLPLSAGPTGGVVNLQTGASRLARSFTLPTNVERAYLDVIAQSQSGDEFWYTCVPDDVASKLQSCGGGAFRETTVYIDGKAAGVAPVYPWIYTGGIDPYLYRPIPAVQTLDFVPYRVDLTPFAGPLSDGRAHEVSIGVHGANGYFSTTGTLFLHLDPGAKQVTGRTTVNTLAAPTPATTENLKTADDGTVTGTVDVKSSRRSTIAGYVDTSHGRVRTEIVQSIGFSNAQTFAISASKYAQKIVQSTTISSLTSTHGRAGSKQVWTQREWPLDIDLATTTQPDKTSAQVTTLDQRDKRAELVTENGLPRGSQLLSNAFASTNTLAFDAAGKVIGPQATKSSQRYVDRDVIHGACYSRSLEAADGLLTKVIDGEACRPDGAGRERSQITH